MTVAMRPGALHAATSLFTVIPVPAIAIDAGTARRSLLAFPWLGLLLGLAAMVPAALVLWVGAGPALAGALAVGVLALLTGGMHLDGLADTADGLGSRRPAEDALAVMKRSDIGPMGVATLVLVLAVEIAALASPRLGWGLLAVVAVAPLIARVTVLDGTRAGRPPARTGGFGALFVGVSSTRGWLLTGVLALAVAGLGGFALQGARGALVLAGAALVAWVAGALWQRQLIRRLGGVTGDTLGSVIEVTQLVFVVIAALSW